MKSLIVAPAWVGDMVMAHTLVRLLAAADPAGRIELVAPPATAPVATRMAEVAAVHELDIPHGVLGLSRRRALAGRLRGAGFHRALVLPNSWKSALLPALARIPRRTGYRGEMRHGLLNDLRRLDRQRLPRMVERFAALALPPGADLPDSLPRPRLERNPAAASALRARLDLEDPAPVLALCPGAEFGPSKQWPAAHFAELATHRIAAGWQVWLFGGPADRAITAAIRDRVAGPARERIHDLAGRTRLTEAVDLLGGVDAVVTNDSGLMHVACALERPVVALYGSTSPDFTPPLGERVASLSLELSCAPCFQRTCPLGHGDCLQQLLPARVDVALETLSAGEAP
jgi:heptosyltransferase-2